MTTFPSLYPNSISLTQGLPQISEYTAFGVGPIRFKHTDNVNYQDFQLVYTAIDQASIQLIRDHYNNNNGTAGTFDVPTAILGGLNATNSSSKYRYVETPTEQHIGLKRYNVTISIVAVEGVQIFFILDGGPATVPAEAAFNEFVFSGTAPFILNGSNSSTATLILNATQS